MRGMGKGLLGLGGLGGGWGGGWGGSKGGTNKVERIGREGAVVKVWKEGSMDRLIRIF